MGMFENLTVQSIVAIIGTAGVTLVGGADQLLITLLMFIALDFVFGLAHAASLRKLDTNKLLAGVIKKLGFLAVIVVAVRLQITLGVPVRDLAIFFLMANEGISLLEHLNALGVPIPKELSNMLGSLSERRDK